MNPSIDLLVLLNYNMAWYLKLNNDVYYIDTVHPHSGPRVYGLSHSYMFPRSSMIKVSAVACSLHHLPQNWFSKQCMIYIMYTEKR